MSVGLAWILDKTRYFALMSRKWYFILKRQETGTKHVAIVTSKCVPSGILTAVKRLSMREKLRGIRKTLHVAVTRAASSCELEAKFSFYLKFA